MQNPSKYAGTNYHRAGLSVDIIVEVGFEFDPADLSCTSDGGILIDPLTPQIIGGFAVNNIPQCTVASIPYFQIERGFTNTAQRNEELDNASWSKSLSAVSAATDPLGGATAWKLRSNNTKEGECYRTVASDGSSSYVVSVIAKKEVFNWIYPWVYFGFPAHFKTWFDLDTPAIGTTNAERSGIASLGDDWCLVWHRKTSTAAAAPLLVLVPTNADGVTTAGDGSSGIYLWRPMYIVSKVAHTPVLSAGADTTRAADVGHWDAADVPASFWSSPYRLRFAPHFTGDENETRYLLAVDANNYMAVNTAGRIIVVAGGVTVLTSSILRLSPYTAHYLDVDPTAGTILLNGGIVGEGKSQGIPWAWTPGDLYLGSDSAGANQIDALISPPLLTTTLEALETTVNSGYATVAPYTPTCVHFVGAGDWGYNAVGYRECLTKGHIQRVRQAGTLSRVKIYCSTKTGLAAFYIKVWRYNGATYDLVGISNECSGNLVTGSTTTFDLTTPITGVREGDYIGYRVESSDGTWNFKKNTALINTTTYYVNDATPGAVGYDWEAQLSVANTLLVIEAMMSPPYYVFIGDSIVSGTTVHNSFCNTGGAGSVDLDGHMSYFAGLATTRAYQNMGIGNQTSTQLAARFTTDVIDLKPKIVAINCGVNDIAGGVITKATFLANYTAMLAAAEADSNIEKVAVILILPWTAGSHAQNQSADDWNTDLVTLCGTYSKAIVVDARADVGKFHVGGDPGNLWDIKTEYDQDTVHYTSIGQDAIARAVIRDAE